MIHIKFDLLSDQLKNRLLRVTNADSIADSTIIQELWSGYGEIIRVGLVDGDYSAVIVKRIAFPKESENHPRGWNTYVSHERKVKSYQVEKAWYSNWNNRLNNNSRTARCLAVFDMGEEQILVLEDLNASAYVLRRSELTMSEVKVCLDWLAAFHALHLNAEPGDLWETGTYWHLKTRMDELNRMPEGPLKEKASAIDAALNSYRYKTIVHGDAKVANFCFSKDMLKVAAVDFQYVGAGCGIKDVMYLFTSCLTGKECEYYEDELLKYYFSALKKQLLNRGNNVEFSKLEQEWYGLYDVAWADFVRFLQGWSPGHYKLNEHSLKKVKSVLSSI